MVELAKGNLRFVREDGFIMYLSWQERQDFEEFANNDAIIESRFFSLVDFALVVDSSQMETPYAVGSDQNFDIHFLNRGYNGEIENQFTGSVDVGYDGLNGTKIAIQDTVKLLREQNTPLTFTITVVLDTPDGTINQTASGTLPAVYPWGNVTFPDLNDEGMEPTIYYITPERGYLPTTFTLDLYIHNDAGQIDTTLEMIRQQFLLNLDLNHEKIIIDPIMKQQLYDKALTRKEVVIRWVFTSDVDDKLYIEQTLKTYTVANALPYIHMISIGNENPDYHLSKALGLATPFVDGADLSAAGLPPSYEYFVNDFGVVQLEQYYDDIAPLVRNYPGEINTPAGNLMYSVYATALKGATIKSIKIEQGDQVIEGLTKTGIVGGLDNAFANAPQMSISTGEFKITVTDSRGLTATKTVKLKILDYVAPTCTVTAVQPTEMFDGKWYLKITGQYHSEALPGTTLHPRLSFGYKLKGEDTFTWEDVPTEEITFNGNNYSALVAVGDYIDGTAGTFVANMSAISYSWNAVYIEAEEYPDGWAAAYYFEKQEEPYQVITSDGINPLVDLGYVQSNEEKISNLTVFDWSAEDFNFNVPVNVNGDMVVNGFNITEDIEYGEWTPVCNCVSAPEYAKGYFLRVKDMVVIQFYFQGTIDVFLPDTALYFSGLPFDTDSDREYAGGGSCTGYAKSEEDGYGVFTCWSIEGDLIYGRIASPDTESEVQSYPGGVYRFMRAKGGGYIRGGLLLNSPTLYASGTIAYKCNI